MKEKYRKLVAAGLVAAFAALVGAAILLPRLAHAQPASYYTPTVFSGVAPASIVSGSWSNYLVPQSSATAFNGQTNRTKILDTRGLGGKTPVVSLQCQFQVTASTATTNLAIRFAASHDSLTNGFGGVETNAAIFWTWTIPTVATANPQLVTAVTNMNLDAIGPAPYIYMQSMWFGYCDGYMTNWSLKVTAK